MESMFFKKDRCTKKQGNFHCLKKARILHCGKSTWSGYQDLMIQELDLLLLKLHPALQTTWKNLKT